MKKWVLTDFAVGFIAGFVIAAIIFSVVAGFVHARNKDREKIRYVEIQQEIEAMREEVINLAIDDLLELPDVRRAADGAAVEFERKRDEILERFRNRLAD